MISAVATCRSPLNEAGQFLTSGKLAISNLWKIQKFEMLKVLELKMQAKQSGFAMLLRKQNIKDMHTKFADLETER